MAKSEITIMDRALRDSYLGLVADLINERKLPDERDNAGKPLCICNYIAQMYTLDGAYSGAVLYIDGPEVMTSNGRDAAYRKYVMTNADWSEERIFDDIGSLYRYLARTLPVFKRASFAANQKNDYELVSTSTTNVSQWARNDTINT